MHWKRERLKNFRLYAITDFPHTLPSPLRGEGKGEGGSILEKIHSALRGGVDVIQLRSKTLPDRTLFELGKKIRALANRMKKLFIVNDRVDLMLACGADGVHLGQEDLPIHEARRLCGRRHFLIGRSTHSLKQALQAEREGADYIGFGPIFGTPTKPNYPPVGLNSIRDVVSRVKIPVVCIGGIDRENIEQVIQAGASRVAVVRAIFAAKDPGAAARVLVRHCEAAFQTKPKQSQGRRLPRLVVRQAHHPERSRRAARGSQ